MIKEFLEKRKQNIQLKEKNIQLEDKILRSIDKAESLIDSEPDRGKEFLHQAEELYHQRGYTFKIERRINDVFLSYMRKYPP